MEYCNIPGIKRLEEMYDLRELAGIASCEEIEFFNIEEALTVSKQVILERISPSIKQSRHVVICISGFLTEDVDKKESWRHAINHFKYSEVYALNWTSLSVNNMFTDGHFEGKSFKRTRYFMFLKTGRKQFTWA
jgi:hypothetical protein